MNNFGIGSVAKAIKKFDQNIPDLIYNLSLMPSWMYLPYEKDGLYDRVMQNNLENKDLPLVLENDEYQWFRQPLPSGINNTVRVTLIRPGIDDSLGIYSLSSKETLTLELAYWKSTTYKNIQAVSWVNSEVNIKPFKILKHEWEINHISLNRIKENIVNYICKKCNMKAGRTTYSSNSLRVPSAILPNKLLTCEQAIIEDIIV